MDVDVWLNAFLALFAILNPLGNMAIFADFTEDLSRRDRFRVFNVAAFTGLVTLLIMSLAGSWIMTAIFQIEIDEFRIAGGIILTVLSVRYIVFPPAREAAGQRKQESVMQMGVVPMAVPLLVGPGSIVTGILILDRDGVLVSVTATIAVFLVVWGLLQISPAINRLIGTVGRLVIGRVLWIFIGAIGISFLTTGISGVFNLAL